MIPERLLSDKAKANRRQKEMESNQPSIHDATPGASHHAQTAFIDDMRQLGHAVDARKPTVNTLAKQRGRR